MTQDTAPSIDVDIQEKNIVHRLLRRHLPDVAVWAHGSRVQWNARAQSDLDLVAFASPQQRGAVSRLREAFEESSLPFSVDVLIWDDLPVSFHRNIEARYVVLQGNAMMGTGTVYGTFSTRFTESNLGNLCEKESGIQTGPFGSQLHQKDYVAEGTPIITVEHLGENRIIHQDLPRVSDYDRARLSKYALQTGDTVFSRVGSVDRRSLVRESEDGWLFSGRCLRVRPDQEKIDSGYLSYFLGLPAFREYIRSIAVGATMPSLNTSLLSDVPIYYPPLPEQRAIAHVLGTLDDKIELNHQMNQTLEAMAQAIFKDWFVDFGPVRAKIEGQEPYLPPDLWELFPDRLVDSKLGEIPEGWEMKEFNCLISDVIGGDWGKGTPDSMNTEAVSIIRGTDLPRLKNGGSKSIPRRYTTQKKLVRRKLEDGDIVIEVSGGSPTQPTGRAMLITESILARFSTPVVCASFCRRFRPVTRASGIFAAQHLEYLALISKMWEYQLQSTGIANFQTTRFLEEELVPWPGKELLKEFESIVGPIAIHISANENQALEAQRDALLPKLVSGALTVGQNCQENIS